jgi:hypothetical protein
MGSVISWCELNLVSRDVDPEYHVKVSDSLLRLRISCPLRNEDGLVGCWIDIRRGVWT